MEAIEVSETQVEERLSEIEEDQDLDGHEFEVETRLYFLAPPDAISEFQQVRSEFHQRLDGCLIHLVFTHKDMKSGGKAVNGKAVKVPAMWQDLYGAHALVIIRASIWDRFENGTLEARHLGRLFDHELCHIDWDGMKRAVKILEAPHEFPQVITRWGVDENDPLQRAIAEQLELDLDEPGHHRVTFAMVAGGESDAADAGGENGTSVRSDAASMA